MNWQADSSWRAIHPFVVVTFLLFSFILAFMWENPLFLTVQLLALLIWLGAERKLAKAGFAFRFGLAMMLLFMLINPLFQSNGTHLLWRGPIIPVIGRLDVSVEELMYSFMGVLRLSIILLLSCAYQWFVDHDRFLFFFARVTPRFVMTSVMAIRLFPFMQQEFKRIQEVMVCRGIRPKGRGIKEKINYLMLILKPLVYSGMEGSWITAETLYARGFGSGKRSFFRQQAMNQRERIALFLMLAMLLFGMFGKLLSFGSVQFYPAFVWADPTGDALFVMGLKSIWALTLLWMRRGRTNDEHISM